MRETGFVPLTEAEGLGALLARSHDAPVLLFLHDDFCPISGRAYEEMREVLRLPDAGATPTMLVDVRRDRAVSRAIEAQTGVRHESPQAIVLRHGKAVWDASHFAITAEAVTGAIAANG
jgi:bacillithiol system protein YtxJ